MFLHHRKQVKNFAFRESRWFCVTLGRITVALEICCQLNVKKNPTSPSGEGDYKALMEDKLSPCPALMSAHFNRCWREGGVILYRAVSGSETWFKSILILLFQLTACIRAFWLYFFVFLHAIVLLSKETFQYIHNYEYFALFRVQVSKFSPNLSLSIMICLFFSSLLPTRCYQTQCSWLAVNDLIFGAESLFSIIVLLLLWSTWAATVFFFSSRVTTHCI